MKKCTKCGAEKPLDEFHHNKNTKDGRAYNCKQCMGLRLKTHRETNDAYKERQITQKNDRTNLNRQFLWDHLSNNPCEHCGNDDPRVLEFDHIDTNEKTADISYLVTRASLETLKEEIAKCRVLCANCHRIRTAYQFNYWWTKL